MTRKNKKEYRETDESEYWKRTYLKRKALREKQDGLKEEKKEGKSVLRGLKKFFRKKTRREEQEEINRLKQQLKKEKLKTEIAKTRKVREKSSYSPLDRVFGAKRKPGKPGKMPTHPVFGFDDE